MSAAVSFAAQASSALQASLADADLPAEQPVAVRYMLEADAAPGLLSRVLQPFARCDLTPDRMWAHRTGDDLHVEVAFEAMPEAYAPLMEGHLSRVVGVRSVLRIDRRHNGPAGG